MQRECVDVWNNQPEVFAAQTSVQHADTDFSRRDDEGKLVAACVNRNCKGFSGTMR